MSYEVKRVTYIYKTQIRGSDQVKSADKKRNATPGLFTSSHSGGVTYKLS
jgi:hypothetical protein